MNFYLCIIVQCCIVVIIVLSGCEYVPNRPSTRGHRSKDPPMHSVPFLIRVWDEVPNEIVFSDLIESTVLAGAQLCETTAFDCTRIKRAMNHIQSSHNTYPFYDFAAVSAAIHFGDLFTIHPERYDLFVLSNQMFETIASDSPEKFARTLERFYSKYANQFVHIFGNFKLAYQSFEYLFAILHMEMVPIADRRSLMLEFTKFVDNAQNLIDARVVVSGGEFERVNQSIILRKIQLEPLLLKLEALLINPPFIQKRREQ